MKKFQQQVKRDQWVLQLHNMENENKKPWELPRQCIHVKMDKVVHSALRIILLQKNLHLQELLEEFATQLVAGDMYAIKILEDLLQKKINERIKKKQKKHKKVSTSFKVDEQDTGMLYKLIEAAREQALQELSQHGK